MSDIKICDKCGTIFAAKTAGSSHITSGVVYKQDGTQANLAGDLCDICTTELTGSKVVRATISPAAPDENFTEAPAFTGGIQDGS